MRREILKEQQQMAAAAGQAQQWAREDSEVL
jgi:hypothetical protein